MRAPNSSARAGFSVSSVRRSIMLMRDTNFFQEAESKSRILGVLHSNRTRGRKARREGGGNQDNQRDEQPIRSVFEHDAHSERVSFCAPPNWVRRGKSPPKGTSAGHITTKARGGRPLRACFDFNLSSLSRARKILRASREIFQRIPLTKRAHREGQLSKSAVPARAYTRAGTAIGWAGGASSLRMLIRSAPSTMSLLQ